MNTNQIKVFETQALRCLGGSCKRNRTDLRNLPHEIIDRGRRMSQARLYKTADVLTLRKSYWATRAAEIEQIKQSFNNSCNVRK